MGGALLISEIGVVFSLYLSEHSKLDDAAL